MSAFWTFTTRYRNQSGNGTLKRASQVPKNAAGNEMVALRPGLNAIVDCLRFDNCVVKQLREALDQQIAALKTPAETTKN
ncbi:MAG: hypothetical protein J0I98_06960 [Mesorhizobium sp.]|nr:hypothetical protein [Mesorhizobium sp.]MBN9242515.1 hypothetical protein [Mesorhizobium sp.]